MNSHKRSFVAEVGLPVLVGILIEVSSDLLKYVTHYLSTSVASELSLGVVAELRRPDFWMGILFVIALVAVSLWILENWPHAHPIRAVRISLVILSVIVAGSADPFGRVFSDEILAAYKQAWIGESMSEVLIRKCDMDGKCAP